MRRGLLVVMLVALAAAVPAWADAPNPLPFSTHALVTDNPDGSRTLTVYGGTDATSDPAWHWPANAKDCHLVRAGAGVAVAWNDPMDSGNELTGPLGTVGVGTAADNVVHPTPQVDPAMPAAVDISDLSDWHDWRSGCGAFVNGVSQGTWGPFSHTYPASVTGALLACPVFYDVAGTAGGEPATRNEVTAGGNPHNDDNSVEANAWDPTQPGCVTSNVEGAHLVVDKQVAPEHGDTFADSIDAAPGDVVRYRFVVTNDGTVDLTAVGVNEITAIADCDPVGQDGFTGALPAGQTVAFTCTHTVGASTLVNVATASGSYLDGGESVDITSDPDSATVHVAPPKSAVAIDNAGPASASAGDTIGYVLTVTNPGQQPLAEPVRVTDEDCDGDPVELLGKSADLTPGSLDPGDVWTYTCTTLTAFAETSVHNVATVEAADPHGATLTASDAVDTTLKGPAPGQAVLGERILTGRARLLGPTGCQAKSFLAKVRGTNVATITFVLDGKVIKRVTDVRSKTVSVRIDPQDLTIGIHRLTANVTFKPATRLKPKSLRISFQRCAKKLVAPRFTG